MHACVQKHIISLQKYFSSKEALNVRVRAILQLLDDPKGRSRMIENFFLAQLQNLTSLQSKFGHLMVAMTILTQETVSSQN